MKFFILFGIISGVLASEMNSTDLVDLISSTILTPTSSKDFMEIIAEESREVEADPENSFEDLAKFEQVMTVPDSEDYLSSESTFDYSTEYPTTDIPAETTEIDRIDDIVQMTTKQHELRVQLANFAHTIQSQKEIISSLTQKVRDLENDVSQLKTERNVNLTRCESTRDELESEMNVAKKLIMMEKYSRGLRKMFKEFKIDESVQRIPTIMRFSMFEIETNDISGKILSDHHLLALPPNLQHIFPNVSELSASGCGLIAINKASIEGMSDLLVLNLSRNKISEIESESFKTLELLQVLDLSLNMIHTIEERAFDGLNELVELQLHHNHLQTLTADVFDRLLNLEILNLSFNRIQEINEEIFTGINVVQEFYINNNQLERINPKLISDFESARIIDFVGNVCVDQKFPETISIVQLAVDIASKCWRPV